MAVITLNDPTAPFGSVKVNADVAGDQYPNDNLSFVVIQNQAASQSLVVDFVEQLQCTHPHHGLINMQQTIAPGIIWSFPPLDARIFADSGRLSQVLYSFVEDPDNPGPIAVFIAGYRGY